ncbi:hypothetical protein LCGC14_1714230 [marine sediment metagenome]|uniref:Uncharacterized protein n=1 Tax=marine sediment metagenome TaxID=412755 RepID=A0A0F9HE32_9ZZZZ
MSSKFRTIQTFHILKDNLNYLSSCRMTIEEHGAVRKAQNAAKILMLEWGFEEEEKKE